MSRRLPKGGSSQVGPGLMIDLHELDRGAADLDEGDDHARAGTVWLDDDMVALQGRREVVNLERHVRHGLYKIRIRCAFPVPLPLNAKWIIQMIADRHLQVRQRNLAFERLSRRDSDMVELHRLTIWRPVNSGAHDRPGGSR